MRKRLCSETSDAATFSLNNVRISLTTVPFFGIFAIRPFWRKFRKHRNPPVCPNRDTHPPHGCSTDIIQRRHLPILIHLGGLVPRYRLDLKGDPPLIPIRIPRFRRIPIVISFVVIGAVVYSSRSKIPHMACSYRGIFTVADVAFANHPLSRTVVSCFDPPRTFANFIS